MDEFTYLWNLANKATKGKWIPVGAWVETDRDDLPDIVCSDWDDDRGPNDSEKQRFADAEYIAAVNPVVVKDLIYAIRQLRRMVMEREGKT